MRTSKIISDNYTPDERRLIQSFLIQKIKKKQHVIAARYFEKRIQEEFAKLPSDLQEKIKSNVAHAVRRVKQQKRNGNKR